MNAGFVRLLVILALGLFVLSGDILLIIAFCILLLGDTIGLGALVLLESLFWVRRIGRGSNVGRPPVDGVVL